MIRFVITTKNINQKYIYSYIEKNIETEKNRGNPKKILSRGEGEKICSEFFGKNQNVKGPGS